MLLQFFFRQLFFQLWQLLLWLHKPQFQQLQQRQLQSHPLHNPFLPLAVFPHCRWLKNQRQKSAA